MVESKREGSENLNDLFMGLFTPEFLESLSPEQRETVINNLGLVESSSETIPPEWLALKNVLQERGYLDRDLEANRP